MAINLAGRLRPELYEPGTQCKRHINWSFWLYQYDNLGQVISGKRYWRDGTPLAGQQFGYGFDDIGNRTSTQAGGDAHGAGLRTASYTANTLNQITSRDIPGAVDIIGAATATATNVNVNGQTAYRRGEYYWKELSVNNASAAQWQSVTNRAVQTGTTNTVTGSVFLPKTPESLSYDADGNLTNDGRWTLTWDAENRLVQIESQSSAPTASQRKVVFTYDYHGRMVRRTEYNGSSGSYVITNDLKLLYDGWRCVAELNATKNQKSYMMRITSSNRWLMSTLMLGFGTGFVSAADVNQMPTNALQAVTQGCWYSLRHPFRALNG